MKNFKNKKTLQIVLLVVIAVVTLGIGYAAISAVNLIINGNATASVEQNNFKVHFTQAQSITGTTGVSGTSSIDSEDDTKATFDVTGLTKVGDYAEAVYTVRNDSNGIGAEITLNLTSSNTEYFKVTETIQDDKLQAGEETTAKVRVEMIKTPVTDAVSTTITATLTASPLEDVEASGGEEKSMVGTKPYVYSVSDVWLYINQEIPNNVVTYTKFSQAKEAFNNRPAAIAHILGIDGAIKESYISFEKNEEVFYLRAGVDESVLDNKPIYQGNVATLKRAYGSNWSDYCFLNSDGSGRFYCNDGALSPSVDNSGHVNAGVYGWHCYNINDKTQCIG